MKGLVIMPIYEEFSELPNLINNINEDILIIDDGSNRNARPHIKDLIYTNYVKLEHKGKGNALKHGFNYAIRKNYDYVITIDSDGEHFPEDILKFKKKILTSDIVIGQRKEYRSMKRKILNYIGKVSFRPLLNKIDDTQCGFRAIRIDLLKKLKLKSD
ncbi:MAG: glycosyltransferase family 2 protein, partial [Nanobdellota archaeon]